MLGKVEYPMVPGHELAGIVSHVGSKVTKFKVNDKIGVGCMVDSCGSCDECLANQEQKCKKMSTSTYGGKNRHGGAATFPPESRTLGGYTDVFIVHEKFGIKIPDSYDLQYAGPVMCSGITMYDPMLTQNIKKGDTVGIIGLGGLGQMGAKIAKALGCKVTVISRNMTKEKFAKRCGADAYVASESAEMMQANEGTIDLILNTIPAYHDYTQYQPLLKPTGKQVLLGLHKGMFACTALGNMGLKSSRIIASGIGGIKATQQVMDLCAKHDIKPEITVAPVSQLNTIFEALDSGTDNGTRYVLDIKTLVEGATCTPNAPPALQDIVLPTKRSTLWEIITLFFSFKWW
jgi:D-arabinose 1-dehydrogenase-like Zn-dependent alcohol dehydrogenase